MLGRGRVGILAGAVALAALAASLALGPPGRPAAACGAGSADHASDSGGPAPAAVTFRFPDDEWPHGRPTEWWDYSGHLAAADGDRYGFRLIVYRLERPDGPLQVAHFSVLDHAAARSDFAERAVSAAGQPLDALRPDVGPDWSVYGWDGQDHIAARSERYTLQLNLVPLGPPVANGGGYLHLGVAGESFHYARPRLSAFGALARAGRWRPVTGLVRTEHHWGDPPLAANRHRFWLSFADGGDLLLVLRPCPDGTAAVSHGSWLDGHGATQHLAAGSPAGEPIGAWTSPATGRIYPGGWRLRLADLGADLTVRPVLPDQEAVGRAIALTAWSGEVQAEGVIAGQPRPGRGYAEFAPR